MRRVVVPAFAFGCFCGVASVSGQDVVLFGHNADYESQMERYEIGLPSLMTARGEHEELRVLARDIGGFLVEERRPIFQFDISGLGNYVASATFSVNLLSAVADEPFSIEVWGLGANRSAPLFAGDSDAAGEFGNVSYGWIQTSWTAPLDETAQPGTFSMDVADFLNDRWEEYLDDDIAWIYFRLQSAAHFQPGSGVDVAFSFASADHAVEGNRPRIDAVLIPEPRHLIFWFSAAAAVLALGRRCRLARR